MVIVVFGPSGSGKDTQSRLIIEKLNIPNISTGRLMRNEIMEFTEIGRQIEPTIASGKWVSDEVVKYVLDQRLKHEDVKNGFVLNGFPRRVSQFSILDEVLEQCNEKLVAAIQFVLNEEQILERMKTQIEHGEVRPDKTIEAIKARHESYNETFEPIVEEFKKRDVLVQIDASGSIDEIHKEVMEKLKERILRMFNL